MPPDFPHDPPPGYSYETQLFRTNVLSIWLRSHSTYCYNGGNTVATIWGFYDINTKKYFAPINSTKKGNSIDVNNTTAYSSMQIELTPLEKCFL